MPAGSIFLSYNSADRAPVLALSNQLRQRGLTTFVDHDGLTRGTPWFDELQGALAAATVVAVVFGRSGIGPWQKREIALAVDNQVRAEQAGEPYFVVPVLLPGAELDAVPPFLRLNTVVDLRGDARDAEIAASRRWRAHSRVMRRRPR